MSVVFFSLFGLLIGSLPLAVGFKHLGVLYLGVVFFAFLPAALAGALNGLVLLVYASFARSVGQRVVHAIGGGGAGWLAVSMWSVLNGRFQNVPPELFWASAKQFLSSMFELPALLPFFAGAVCAVVFNPWAVKWLQPNLAVQDGPAASGRPLT